MRVRNHIFRGKLGFLHHISHAQIVNTIVNKQPMIVSLFGPHFLKGQQNKMKEMPVLIKDGEAEYIKKTHLDTSDCVVM